MELFKQRKSKFWWVDLRVNGQRIRKSTGQTTRARASEVAASLIDAARRGEKPTIRSHAPTLREFAQREFLPYVLAHAELSDNTKDYYRLGWLSIESQSIADLPLDAIRKSHAETLSIPGSRATHNRALRMLKRCLNVAHDLDLLNKVPKFSMLEEIGRSELIAVDVESRMATSLTHTKRKSALQVGLYIILDCGLRPIEIVRLSIPNLDFTDDVIHVTRLITKTRWGVRSVPMTQRVKALLLERLKGRSTGWVFPSPRYREQHIQRQALTVAWRKHANKAGLPANVALYCARHTYGTDVMAATRDPFLTRKLMGHSDLKTTDRYQHPQLVGVGALMDTRNRARMDILSVIPDPRRKDPVS